MRSEISELWFDNIRLKIIKKYKETVQTQQLCVQYQWGYIRFKYYIASIKIKSRQRRKYFILTRKMQWHNIFRITRARRLPLWMYEDTTIRTPRICVLQSREIEGVLVSCGFLYGYTGIQLFKLQGYACCNRAKLKAL